MSQARSEFGDEHLHSFILSADSLFLKAMDNLMKVRD